MSETETMPPRNHVVKTGEEYAFWDAHVSSLRIHPTPDGVCLIVQQGGSASPVVFRFSVDAAQSFLQDFSDAADMGIVFSPDMSSSEVTHG